MTVRIALVLAVFALGCSEKPSTTLARAAVGTSRAPVLGADDAGVITGSVVLNQYSVLAANASAGATTIEVTSVADLTSPLYGPLDNGDLLLVMQMQGASINTGDSVSFGSVSSLNGAGLYEYVEVAAVNGATNTITVSNACNGLKNSYTTAGRTQVIRVPQFTTLTVTDTGTVTAPPWDGQKGGIVAIHVQDTLTLNGTIDVTGLGFRGGATDSLSSPAATDVSSYRGTTGAIGGEKGEGIAGSAADYDALGGRFGRGAPANGGGGANSYRAGGGGGANASNGNTWSGQGVMDGLALGAPAWQLDPGRTSPTSTLNLANNSGGGRGGYSFSSSNLNATVTGPANSAWGGNSRRERGGLGGRGLTPDPRSRLFLGGGGGAGDGSTPGGGGRGGGLAYIMADRVTGAGAFVANGSPGESTSGSQRDGAGGGGAGGTVVLRANELNGFSISANGGAGGQQVMTAGIDEAGGPGGGGAGGFIATSGGSVTPAAVGGPSGFTTSNGLTEFPVNGATNGASGSTVTTLTALSGGVLSDLGLCLAPADLSVTLTNSAATSTPGTSTEYTLTVTNQGPGLARNARVVNTLPPQLTGASWKCTGASGGQCPAAMATGSIDRFVTLPSGGSVTFVVTATIIASATGDLTNTAVVYSPPTINDPNLGNNVATDIDPLLLVADLRLILTATPTPVDEDGLLTWRLQISNLGPSQANSLTATFTRPSGFTVANNSWTVNGWSCSLAGTSVTCTRPNLAVGSVPSEITIVGTVTLAGGKLTGVASVAATATGSAQSTDPVAIDNSATREIDVDAVNDAPVNTIPSAAQTIFEDATLLLSTGEGNPIKVDDEDADPNPIQLTLSGINGVVTLGSTAGLVFDGGTGTGDRTVALQGRIAQINSALNGLVFRPDPNFVGSAGIQVVVNDLGFTGKGGAKSDTDTVGITVRNVNDPPTALADDFSVPEDSMSLSLNVLGNDTTAPDQGETMSVVAVTAPMHGTIVNANSSVFYTPAPDYFGPDTFSYSITDGNDAGATAVVTVTVSPVNDPPDAGDDTASIAIGDTNVLIPVLNNDTTFPDVGETLTVIAVTTPANGTAVIDPNGVRYTPAPGFSGADVFTYTVGDGNGGTDTATVNLTVSPANRPPVIGAPATVTISEDTSVLFSPDGGLGLVVSDPDANTQPVQMTVTATNGTFSLGSTQGLNFSVGTGTDDVTLQATAPLTAINAALSGARYRPTGNFNGAASLVVAVNDLGNTGGGGARNASTTIAVTVTPVSDPPTANPDTYSVLEDDPGRVLDVRANDSILPDTNETLTITSVTAPMHGVATISGGSAITYKPNLNYTGPDSFQYTVNDGSGLTSTATVTLDVTAVNDPPPAVDDVATVAQDTEAVIQVLANDAPNPDGMETLTVYAVSGAKNGMARVDTMTNSVIYKPNPTFVGPETLSYVVSDGNGGFSSAFVFITVGEDQDRDGLSAAEEMVLGTFDNDPDSDDDGLLDGIEVKVSKTSPLDVDTDDDGILDGNEDANKNGVVDPGETKPLVADTDMDGLCDGLEIGLAMAQKTASMRQDTRGGVCAFDLDPATRTNPLKADTDSGGDADNVEDANLNGRVDPGETDPTIAADDRVDADKDGLRDQQELAAGLDPLDADTDDDGVLDGADGLIDSDDDGIINALEPDSDGDGVLDGTERGVTSDALSPATALSRGRFVADADPSTVTDPTRKDTDGDSLEDGVEDADHDGAMGEAETDASRADSDADGLPDGLERRSAVGTDPRNPDTDGDGLLDGEEDANANGKVEDDETNPTLADTDRGGAPDGREVKAGSNPLNPADDWQARGGGGCSTGLDGPLPWLLVFAVMLAVGRRRRHVRALVAAVLVAGSAAQAQAINTSVDVQRFKPGTGSQDFLNIEAASVAPHLSLYAGLFVGYANAPLVLQMVGSTGMKDQRRIVNDLTWFDLSAGIALADHFELGVALPLSIARGQPAPDIDPVLSEAVSGFGLGDLRLAPKYSFFSRDSTFQLAASMPISFPTGNGDRFRGGGPVTASPRIAAEVTLPMVRLVANVGALVRTRPVQILNVSLGQEVTWGLGGVIPVGSDRLSVMLAVNGSMPMGRFTPATVSVEGMAGLRLKVADSLVLELAGGAGLSRGLGAPIGQVVFGASYQSQPIAMNSRGRARPVDVEPEVDEGDESAKAPAQKPVVAKRSVEAAGPPPPPPPVAKPAFIDSDRDGIADEQDRCPGQQETINGITDDDGCPDTGLGAVSFNSGRLALLKPIAFAQNSPTPTDASMRILDQLALVLKANPAVRVRIDVFVTEAASRGDNEALSGKRARQLSQELVRRGVDTRRILAQGHGMERPMDPSSVEISTQ